MPAAYDLPAGSWSSARWVVGLTLLFLAGCTTDVPYDDPTRNPTGDDTTETAPPFDAGSDAQDDMGNDATAETTADASQSGAEAAETIDPPPADVETPESGRKLLPWETAGDDSEPSPDAARLFGDADETPPPAQATAPPAGEPANAEDGFGALLADAYGDMSGPESEPDGAPPETEPPKTEPPAPERSAGPTSLDADALDDLFGEVMPAEASPPSPAPTTADASPQLPEPKAPTAKPPTETATESSDPLDDLWGDDTFATDPPAPDVAAPPAEIDEPSPPAAAPQETLEDLPPPESEPAPPPAEAEPPRADPVTRRGPRAGGIEPLPAVPVLPYNTRHLAWLLGGKLGLAELADLDGATATELAGWSAEVDRLARELGIPNPGTVRSSDTDPVARVTRLLKIASATGSAIASEHGTDHAALLEIALKTNAVLVLAEKRPELAAPIGRAIAAAADRAQLPQYLWEETAQTLQSGPTAEEALEAVTRLHERVESNLR